VLTPEQQSVASQIIDAVMQKTDELMFLQGSAGTGKPFTVNALNKGGTTPYSLFHLGIDE
jgi:hypothetical protein